MAQQFGNIKGQKAIITGASGGIGRSVAIGLAESGVDVALLGRNEANLNETKEKCEAFGTKAYTIVCDLGDMSTIKEVVDTSISKLGSIDILINNAGAIYAAPVQEADTDEWDRLIDINLRSLMYMSRHTVPHLIKQNGGTIVNIASSAGRATFPQFAVYSATKHAVLGFSGCLFDDVREHGIKVTTLLPGFVNTGMVKSLGLNPEKMIQPEDISHAVNFVAGFPGTGCPTEITIKPQRIPKFDK
jgi:3-oxoacyl-[acyl-carrier protein] reductase